MKKKIKILFLITSFNKDGPGNVLLNIVKNLDKDKFLPVVACLYLGDGELQKYLSEMGVETFNLGMSKDKIGWFDVRIVARLIKLLKSQKPDLIHIHLIRSVVFGGISALLMKIPFVITIHNTEFYLKKTNLVYLIIRKIESEILRRANSIICVSKGVEDFIKERYPKIDASKILTIYNGVSIDYSLSCRYKGSLRKEFNIPEDAIVIGFVGRLEEQKGLTYLIEAANLIIKSRICDNIKIFIVGKGEEKDKLLTAISKYELNNFFIFTGFRKDVEKILIDFDIFVLPSLWEGLPMALLEGMSFGLPCVVTDVPGAAEVIGNGKNGFIVKPGDPGALATALISLIKDDSLRKKMGEAAKNSVISKYTAKAMSENYSRLYINVLNQGDTT